MRHRQWVSLLCAVLLAVGTPFALAQAGGNASPQRGNTPPQRDNAPPDGTMQMRMQMGKIDSVAEGRITLYPVQMQEGQRQGQRPGDEASNGGQMPPEGERPGGAQGNFSGRNGRVADLQFAAEAQTLALAADCSVVTSAEGGAQQESGLINLAAGQIISYTLNEQGEISAIVVMQAEEAPTA